MAGAGAPAPSRRLGRRGLRFLRRLGSAVLPIPLGVPTTPREREGSDGDLAAHGVNAFTGRAIMVIQGRNSLELFFGFPAGFASVFIQRHGFLVIMRAFGPNLEV